MKKIAIFGLIIGCMAGIDAMAVQVKNKQLYGVAKREPSTGVISKIVNICTTDVVNCNFGPVTVDDVVIPRDQLNVSIVVNGITINPGETKEVGASQVVYLSAYYTVAPGSRFPVQYSAFAIKPVLSFPEDFVRVQ